MSVADTTSTLPLLVQVRQSLQTHLRDLEALYSTVQAQASIPAAVTAIALLPPPRHPTLRHRRYSFNHSPPSHRWWRRGRWGRPPAVVPLTRARRSWRWAAGGSAAYPAHLSPLMRLALTPA